MQADLLVTGFLFHKGRVLEGGIAVVDGKIWKVGKESTLPKADQTLKTRKLVLPGLIDMHVHLRDMELSHKEDYFTGTCAAVAGGFTTVVDMPNTVPYTDTAGKLKEKMEVAKGKIVCNVGFYCGFPRDLNEVDEINRHALGFKVYTYRSEEEWDPQSIASLVEASRGVVCFHCETPAKKPEPSFFDVDAISALHTENSELEAIKHVLSSVKKSVHICHVSTPASVMVCSGRATCEATPHHLLLSKEDARRIGVIAHVLPPLRNEPERLLRLLSEGRIDVIASDHAPHALEEKEQLAPGFPGLETTLPLMLTLVNDGFLSLRRLVSCLSSNPARILGLENKGEVEEGKDADLTIVDLKAEHVIDASRFYSKAKFSPFDGRKCVGKPYATIIGGEVRMENGELFVKKGCGSVVTP